MEIIVSRRRPAFFIKNEQDKRFYRKNLLDDRVSFPLTLIGYSTDQKMIFTKLVGDNDVDILIPEIFEEHSEIEYLHARNAEAGCFICKIERA